MKLSGEAKLVSGVILLIVPTIMYGGITLLIKIRYPTNQQTRADVPGLVTKPPPYRSYIMKHPVVNQHLVRGWSISRADPADYIVTPLEDPQTYGAQVEVAP